MSSDTAMKKYAGGVANYRSSEGKTVKIPYKGPVENTINDTFYLLNLNFNNQMVN